MPSLWKWVQSQHKAQVSNLRAPYLNILCLNTWNSSVSLKVMPKIQTHKMNQKHYVPICEGEEGGEMQPKRILQWEHSEGVCSDSDSGISSSTAICGAPEHTGQDWVGHKNVADAVVNVSRHILAEHSFCFLPLWMGPYWHVYVLWLGVSPWNFSPTVKGSRCQGHSLTEIKTFLSIKVIRHNAITQCASGNAWAAM